MTYNQKIEKMKNQLASLLELESDNSNCEEIEEWEQWVEANEAMDLTNEKMYWNANMLPDIARLMLEFWMRDINGELSETRHYPKIVFQSLMLNFALDMAKVMHNQEMELVEVN